MICDCLHEDVCRHKTNITLALDPIFVKTFGSELRRTDFWTALSNQCKFKKPKAPPVITPDAPVISGPAATYMNRDLEPFVATDKLIIFTTPSTTDSRLERGFVQHHEKDPAMLTGWTETNCPCDDCKFSREVDAAIKTGDWPSLRAILDTHHNHEHSGTRPAAELRTQGGEAATGREPASIPTNPIQKD